MPVGAEEKEEEEHKTKKKKKIKEQQFERHSGTQEEKNRCEKEAEKDKMV